MKFCLRGALLAVLAFPVAAIEPTRFTDKCNPQQLSVVTLQVTERFMDDVAALMADPRRYADLYARLWEPQLMAPFAASAPNVLRLEYDPRQDASQIAREIAADPTLRSFGVLSAGVENPVCSPFFYTTTLTEWHNTILDHYFLAGSLEENSFIAHGGAGPGWERTPQTFAAWVPPCTNAQKMHRFYGPAAHSHLYTADPQECGGLRKEGTGWLYEGSAFAVTLPSDGECPSPLRPVWRLYNNRAALGDPNHRYVIQGPAMSEMLLRKWGVIEGIAFCVSP